MSNSAQAADDSASTSGNKHAQLFHAGANTLGYTLTNVRVNSEDVENDPFDVEVCEADTTANQFPTTTCTALTAPATFTTGVIATFTHTGLALAANTNYVVVITQRGTASVELNTTTSSGEDTSLGLADWSIKNKFYWQSGSTWMLKSGANEALRIIVSGYANTVADATDATLSALSVSGATLSPAFAAAQTSYHAVVANSVTQGTITTDDKRDDGDGRVSRQLGRHTDGRRHHDRRPPGQPQRGQQHRQGEGDRARHHDHGDLHRQRVSRRRARRVQRRVDDEPDLDGKPDGGDRPTGHTTIRLPRSGPTATSTTRRSVTRQPVHIEFRTDKASGIFTFQLGTATLGTPPTILCCTSAPSNLRFGGRR